MELEGQATSAEPEPERQTPAPAPVPVMRKRNESWLQQRTGDGVSCPITVEPEPEPEPERQAPAPAPVPVMRNESWLEERPGDTVESQPDDQQEMTHARAVQVMQNAARKAMSRRTANNLRGLQSLGVALSMSEREAKRVSRWDEM